MTGWHSEIEGIRAHYQRLQGKTRPENEQLLSEMLTFNADVRAILTRARGVVEGICLELGEQHAIKRKKGALDELITELRRNDLICEHLSLTGTT